MADALQRRGLHGVGLAELLSRADAPKGVLYHHFPGGKTELAVVAIDAIVARLLASLDGALTSGIPLAEAMRDWLHGARRQLEASGFVRGCPLATVALESGEDDSALREALARGFAAIRERLASAFEAAGVEATAARRLAALAVSAYEGGLLQARVAGDARVMHDVTDGLLEWIVSRLPDAGDRS